MPQESTWRYTKPKARWLNIAVTLSFLFLVHSTAFEARLEDEISADGQSYVIKMDDMTEETVGALLKFLYYRDIEHPVANPSIALELLNCADKYGIKELEETMWKILLAQPDHWFDINMGLRLFVFDCPNEVQETFQTRAMQILRRWVYRWKAEFKQVCSFCNKIILLYTESHFAQSRTPTITRKCWWRVLRQPRSCAWHFLTSNLSNKP